MITTRPAASSPEGTSAAEVQLVLADLLHDFAELRELLSGQLEQHHWLDAFLLAAGMNQIVEDHLHRDIGSLAKVAANLRSLPGVGTVVGALVENGRRLALAARGLLPAERRVAGWQVELAQLVLVLAGRVAGPEPADQLGWSVLLSNAERLPKRLRSEVLCLPSCFRSLDLEPRDVDRLMDELVSRWPNRHRQVLVVGLRTSGSYLGPLHAAHLRRRGYENVHVLTLRPGQHLLASEARDLRISAQKGALVVVADDPPSTGGAVVAAASLLERVGFPQSDIVLSLPLIGHASELPERLRNFPAVLLERPDWTVEGRLQPEAVRGALERMLDGRLRVESVRRQSLPALDDPWEEAVDRRHLRALFEVQLRDRAGEVRTRFLYVKGAGLGYFGRHSLAVALGLRDYLPELYGMEGCLLFRAWQPEARRLAADATSADGIAGTIAAYTLARKRALPAGRDLSSRMTGRQAVWQRVADLLAEPFGRLRVVLRPQLHRLARRLLLVETASVVDGSMALRHWFAEGAEGRVVKVDNDERVFSNEDIYSYDHAYDLGSAASSLRVEIGPAAAGALRAAFERSAGERIEEERWFLYQLLSARLSRHALRAHLAKALPAARVELIGPLDAVESALEDVQRDYMRACYLEGVAPAQSGPVCAIDIDGTLETAPLGFTSVGPAGALSLRALALHGYRAILASGRSLEEVRSRCDAYSLAAGVAEYGAVVYDAKRGEVVELLAEADRARLEQLRSALARTDGVWLDKRYDYSVRAYRLDHRGRRQGLTSETATQAMAAADVQRDIIAIPGWSQTDFAAASVSKSDGLRVAADRLGRFAGETLLELAVGDAATDLTMLRLARLACAPADSSPELRAPGIEVMSRRGQAGLAQAVGRLLGHEPGGCRLCRAPEHGRDASLLLGLLAAHDEQGWRRLRRAASLAWELRRG